MGHTDYSMGVDSWKLCCGPFCSDCHVAMERQGERVAQLEAAVKVLAKYADTRMRKTEFLADRDLAERDRKDAARAIKANPIAAAAVMEAGR